MMSSFYHFCAAAFFLFLFYLSIHMSNLLANRHFGPSTLSRGSISSFNFQIGQYSPSTFVLRSNSSLCWYYTP
jgi:hypothetical protein